VARAGGIQKVVWVYFAGTTPPFMGLIIRSSDIHAAGCYTTTPIKKGTMVVEYTGPLITKDQGDKRYEGREYTYLFGMDDGRVIDGHGMAAFINHCCDPNCETDEIGGKLWIIALRDIKAGEELSYDYCLWDGEEDDPAPCYCGAKSCRGTMYSEEEVERLAKVKKGETVHA
jgi:SET domain-containing protein